MAKCPNCGQKTKGDFCQWCGYPLKRGRPVIALKRKTMKAKEAELGAKKAEEAEIKAKRQAEREA